MANDKVLQRMRVQIKELSQLLGEFADPAVQPGAAECERLQTRLSLLQENLAVFKYQKQNQEISPSFNLHARVSEEVVNIPTPAKEEPVKEKPAEPVKTDHETVKASPAEKIKVLPALSIGVNDKFRFINELFAQNPAEYNIAIEQFSSLQTWQDAEIYMNSLKTLYTWKDNHEVVKHFYQTVKKRFE